MQAGGSLVSLSIVIPVYNEVESLPTLHRKLHEALDTFPEPWEALFVDDGSGDGSAALLAKLAADDRAHTSVIFFRRNFGQTAAMAAGFEHARGDIIIPMDADLQNDPADIPMLVAKMAEGYDLVSGWRQARQDTMITRKLPSRIANRIIGHVTGVHLHDYGCTLKAYRAEIIQSFHLYGEMHRFIPVYARAAGAKIVEVPVRHHARQFGKTKYGLGRTLKVILDLFTVKMLTAFSTKPMYLFGKPGLYLIGLGVLAAIAAPILGVTMGLQHCWPLLTIAILLFVLGGQCILLGGLAELLMRTYYEAQDKRPYHIKAITRAAWEAVGSEVGNA